MQTWYEKKLNNSGVPSNIKSGDIKSLQDYCDKVKQKTGIVLNQEKMLEGLNPGMRSIAKLMLNSLWVRTNIKKFKNN